MRETMIPDKVDGLQRQLSELKEKLQQSEKQLYSEMDDLLDNAYLMPFQTRDLARTIPRFKTTRF